MTSRGGAHIAAVMFAAQGRAFAPSRTAIALKSTLNRRAPVTRARLDAGVGAFGSKAGMTHVFTPEGLCVPVTVIAVREGNVVTQVREDEKYARSIARGVGWDARRRDEAKGGWRIANEGLARRRRRACPSVDATRDVCEDVVTAVSGVMSCDGRGVLEGSSRVATRTSSVARDARAGRNKP